MKRKDILTGSVIALTSAFTLVGFSGCQQTATQPQQTPTQVVQNGMKNLTTVTSHQFALTVSGNLNAPPNQTPAKVQFNANLTGSADMKDPQDPRINLQLDGSGNADAQGGSGSAELRLNKDALYFTLSKLQTQGGIDIPQQFMDQYVGKWWELPIPPDTLKQFAAEFPEGGSQQVVSPQEQKVKDLFENTQFFNNLQFVGIDNIKGEQSYHYYAELDKDAFTNFAIQAATAQGKPMADSDIQDLKDAMQKFTFNGNVWVGVDSGILDQVTGDFKFVNTTATDPTGTISVSLTLWNFNQPVTVDVPANTQMFPIDQLMSVLLGGAADSGTGASVDQSSGSGLDQSAMSGLSPAMTQQIDSSMDNSSVPAGQ